MFHAFSLRRCVLGLLLGIFLLTFAAISAAPQPGSAVQVNERNLPQPILDRPIHECALAVHVRGVLPGSAVRVFANNAEVGKGRPFVGELDIQLTRALVLNEVITARQTVGTVTTDPSDPVTVDAVPPSLSTPVTQPPIYACGKVVPVANLTPSTHVEVSDTDPTASLIGTGENPGTWYGVVTSGLQANHHVIADQVACPATAPKSSPPSQPPLAVSASPVPVPPPEVDQPISGTQVVTLHKLLPGAQLDIFAGTTHIGGGLANASDNWFPLDMPMPPGHPIVTAVQTLCTASAPSAPVIASDTVPQPTLAWPICAGSQFVSLYNTIPGAIVQIFWQKAGSSTAISISVAGGVMGKLDMHLGKGAILGENDTIFATQTIGFNASGHSNEVEVGCGGGGNVLTQHNDNARTGAYLAETVLTPAAVRSRKMVRLFKVQLSGSLETQTLYVRNVQFPSGMANAVYEGTDSNSFYALDAANGNPKWQIPLQDSDPTARPKALGMLTTPVIDLTTNRIYVLFRTGNKIADGNDFQNNDVDQADWLVALDIRTGGEVSRTRIAASVYRGDGTVINFVEKTQIAHTALLLDRGSLYITFASRADSESQADAYFPLYHGWLMQYRASDLAEERVFCTTPNKTVRSNSIKPSEPAGGAGIWQGGGGVAADPDGNIFFLTGNGRADLSNATYGDSFVKLVTSGTTLSPTAYAPAVGDPLDDADQLELGDADLGAGGAVVIPGTNLVIGGGKTGLMYLLDRSSTQLLQRFPAATNIYHPDWRAQDWEAGPHLHGSPVFWQGLNFMYIWGEKDNLKAYGFDTASNKFNEQPIQCFAPLQCAPPAEPLTMPGGMLSLSANGNDQSTGVLWAIISIENCDPIAGCHAQGALKAFDARTLELLWDTPIGLTPHWAPPTIADGKVFVPNFGGELMAYGLGPDPNDIHWTPYQPKLVYKQCQVCHGESAQDSLQRKALLKYYINEASVFVLPARTLHQLSLPSGMRKDLVLKGNGVATYSAQASTVEPGKLVWNLNETTAELSQSEPDANAIERAPTVRLSDGPVWTASDGSKIEARPKGTVPAPVSISIPWVSYEVTKTSGPRHSLRILVRATRPDPCRRSPCSSSDTHRYHRAGTFYRGVLVL